MHSHPQKIYKHIFGLQKCPMLYYAVYVLSWNKIQNMFSTTSDSVPCVHPNHTHVLCDLFMKVFWLKGVTKVFVVRCNLVQICFIFLLDVPAVGKELLFKTDINRWTNIGTGCSWSYMFLHSESNLTIDFFCVNGSANFLRIRTIWYWQTQKWVSGSFVTPSTYFQRSQFLYKLPNPNHPVSVHWNVNINLH